MASGVSGLARATLRSAPVFPRDFLDDFGFVTLRAQGRVELCRLDLGGQPIEEGRRAKALRVVQDAFTPARVPVPRP